MDAEFARNYQTEIVLKNGGLLLIRSIRPDDKAALAEAFSQLSKESIYSRFLSEKKELGPAELVYLTELDFIHHVGLAAILPESDPERIVGIARYIVINQESENLLAEVALLVVDQYQARGIGTALLKHLARIAGKAGVSAFEAYVLWENAHIRELFEHCGYRIHSEIEDDLLKLFMDIDKSVFEDETPQANAAL
ncbi:MAG: GNAT family N-acetyltransferase [Syntrophaceae bacterium]|nr:GNAT family N-acetyltransferase [Syntrophaceae bacterium]